MVPKAPAIEAVSVEGPAGILEARVETPAQDSGDRVAVICHPHPQYGGTMDNKVVHTVAAGFRDRGIPSVRFNFRGVGSSDGAFDDGRGETEELEAVVRYAQQRLPARGVWLGGFSFGSGIAARLANSVANLGLVLVAPPVSMEYFSGVNLPAGSLVVHGDRDELIPLNAVEQWLDRRGLKHCLQVVAGADHFFHGQLRLLRQLVVAHVPAGGP